MVKRITDICLIYISKLSELKELNISHCIEITSQGLN